MKTKTSLAFAAVFFALVATGAQARTIAVTSNKSGGSIELTDEACAMPHTFPGERLMFARRPTGEIMFGCYVITDRYVHTRYPDGGVFAYDPDGFTVLKNTDDARAAPARGL